MTGKERIAQFVGVYQEIYGKEVNPIYEITLLEHPCKEWVFEKDGRSISSRLPEISDNRMGFYYELDTAIRAMNENWADIQEFCFHAGFILCHFPGLYNETGPQGRIYFLWDEDRKGFFEAEEPELYKNVAI